MDAVRHGRANAHQFMHESYTPINLTRPAPANRIPSNRPDGKSKLRNMLLHEPVLAATNNHEPPLFPFNRRTKGAPCRERGS